MKYWVGDRRSDGDVYVYYRARDYGDVGNGETLGEKITYRELTDRESRAVALLSMLQTDSCGMDSLGGVGEVDDDTTDEYEYYHAWYLIYEDFK